MKALIDGDIVVHRVGYTTNNDPVGIAYARANEMIEGILRATKADSFEVWLSDAKENNFRYQVWDKYKANRTAPRPVHYDALKKYLHEHWYATVALGQEADDALGIIQCSEPDTIICSIDKDLLQIPGHHYNFVRDEFTFVEHFDGIKHFYRQLLIGDTVDNIRGVDGIGPVKADRALAGYDTELECFEKVKLMYEDDQRLLINGRLLWIRRRENELWSFPQEAYTNLEMEPEQLSTPMEQEETDQSMEPTSPESIGCPVPGELKEDGTTKICTPSI